MNRQFLSAQRDRLALVLGLILGLSGSAQAGGVSAPPASQTSAQEAPYKEDSFKYYGPNGMWKNWTDSQRLGRDTWIFWTWGNQKFLRKVAVLTGNLSVPVSLDFFRALDSRNRETRFRDLGLVNEPNCYPNNQADEFGFYLDLCRPDPLGYYPGTKDYREKYPLTYPGTTTPVDETHYGRPSGGVGLRLFDNPNFDKKTKFDKKNNKKWDVNEYFRNPGRMEPPYLVGFSCAFCHMGFNANNPPADPEKPRWENLAANIGNQYFREGELFLGRGRLLFGDKNPLTRADGDPYQTRDLTGADFLFQYAATQQPGTSETSRISYDFINNPNTINPMFNLAYRRIVKETNPRGKEREIWRILKDGADSVGIKWALMRVPINIGCEGEYWLSRLFDPVSGRRQKPFRIADVLAGLPEKDRKELEEQEGIAVGSVTPERLRELRSRFRSDYGGEFGQDWQEAWRRVEHVKNYLASYTPVPLKEAGAAGAAAAPRDAASLARGAGLFALHCASCHSSKQPEDDARNKGKKLTEPERQVYIRQSVLAKDFLDKNYLADERRYPATELRTNMARALATNAVDGDIWAEFSSKNYKALPPLGRIVLDVPVFPPEAPLPWSVKQPVRVEFEPPGGGRGYYRTPSLVSMWATAPYLHNNALGDYYVVWDQGRGKGWLSTDGTRWRTKKEDRWQMRKDPLARDYRFDVSVEGRLRMFEDGVDKLLNPSRRHGWVKRTSAESSLIPDLENSVRQLLAAIVRDVVRRELASWLKDQQVPPDLTDDIIRLADGILEKVMRTAFDESRAFLRFGWSAVQMRLRDQAYRVFEGLYNDLEGPLSQKLKGRKLPLPQLKTALRRQVLTRLDRLDQQLREAAILKVPAGTPVNLYANLNSSALVYAALAHVRHRDDPRALAQALLQLSDCPDLVEDSGHLYGADLSDEQKNDLIAFLKTL
jgi:mono/diheme cytochrome c family protein